MRQPLVVGDPDFVLPAALLGGRQRPDRSLAEPGLQQLRERHLPALSLRGRVLPPHVLGCAFGDTMPPGEARPEPSFGRLRLRSGLQTSQGVVDALVVPGVDQRLVDALGLRQPVLLGESQLRLKLPEVPAGHRP